MSDTTAPTGATPDPHGSPAADAAPAVEPPTDTPVEPGTTKRDDKSPADIRTPEIERLERMLEEERSKVREARNDAEKKRRLAKETRERAGEFEGLYQEAQAEMQAKETELATIRTTIEQQEAELKTLRAEVKGYRTGLLERFEEADRTLAETTPTDRLPALYERLYSRPMIQTPPPSPGAGRPAAAVQTPGASLEDQAEQALAAGDIQKFNELMNQIMKR